MALYFPPENLAIEIVDDPLSKPVDRDAFPNIRVIKTTCLELSDFDRCERFLDRLAHEMGEERPVHTPADRMARKRLLATLSQMLDTQSYLRSIGQVDAAEAAARSLAGVAPYSPEEFDGILAKEEVFPGNLSDTATDTAAQHPTEHAA